MKILETIIKIILFIPAVPFVVGSALVGGFYGMNEYFFKAGREFTRVRITQALLKVELEKSKAALENSSLDQAKIDTAVESIQDALGKKK